MARKSCRKVVWTTSKPLHITRYNEYFSHRETALCGRQVCYAHVEFDTYLHRLLLIDRDTVVCQACLAKVDPLVLLNAVEL